MKSHRLIAMLVTCVSLMGVAACGSSSKDSGGDKAAPAPAKSSAIKSSKAVGQTTGPNGEKATPTSALTLSAAEIEKVKAGHYTAALVWPQSADFTTAVTSGAKDEFAKLGIQVVATTDANFDAGKQKSDIETVLAKKPSVMLSLPVDPVASASTYRAAGKAGAKLVFLSNVPKGMVQGKDYVTTVTDDLFQMGKQAADALASAIGGKGKIGYFFHDATFYVTNQRDQAFKKTIEANYPNIKIVAQQGIADPNKAEEQANAMLLKNPDLDGVYATWSSPPGEAVLSALRNNGNTKAKIVSLDLSEPLAVDMVRGGHVTALVTDRAYELGQAMAKAAAYGLLGKEAPPFLVVPATTVTKANLIEGYEASLHRSPPKPVLDAR
jgi:ribose transport system substrate-binding protein